MRGISQVDFAIATGMFILLFALFVGTTSDHLISVKEELKELASRSDALSLLNSLSSFGLPAKWYENVSINQSTLSVAFARVFNAFTNETKSIVTNELKSYGDGSYFCISPANGENAIEIVFESANLTSDVIVGSSVFLVVYNATAFERDSGKGDKKDDALIFSKYFADWGGIASDEWTNWSFNIGEHVETPEQANSIRITLYYVQEAEAKLCMDYASVKLNWTKSKLLPLQFGLGTRIYEVKVIANNSKPFYINQSANVTNLTNELILVNFSQLGFASIDFNSVKVFDENFNQVPCNVSPSNATLSFVTNLSTNETKIFTVRFDDDSNYTNAFCNSSVVGNNSIVEKSVPFLSRKVMQLRKIELFKHLDYLILKRRIGLGRDFRVKLRNESDVIFELGKAIPRAANIHAFERDVLCQDERFELKKCELSVYVIE